MMNAVRTLSICLGLLGMSIALAGCAAEVIPYPKFTTIKKLKNKLLSREEQIDVMRNLAAEQEQHQKSAISEIEKPL